VSLVAKLICIDPGHGHPDPGAVSQAGHKESDIALAIAKQIQAREDWLPGVKFVYTRLEDKRLAATALDDLAARVNFANSHKADLFVSVHLNADDARAGSFPLLGYDGAVPGTPDSYPGWLSWP